MDSDSDSEDDAPAQGVSPKEVSSFTQTCIFFKVVLSKEKELKLINENSSGEVSFIKGIVGNILPKIWSDPSGEAL